MAWRIERILRDKSSVHYRGDSKGPLGLTEGTRLVDVWSPRSRFNM